MEVYTDEVFGPVLSVMRVNTLEEAIELINRNSFANGTAITSRWPEDLSEAGHMHFPTAV
jgi:malonate-semialdehyde dehydrogenase (acetylating)/methylmalonate-semialdehyde dehydrogenase